MVMKYLQLTKLPQMVVTKPLLILLIQLQEERRLFSRALPLQKVELILLNILLKLLQVVKVIQESARLLAMEEPFKLL
jgi:hypothetical protein